MTVDDLQEQPGVLDFFVSYTEADQAWAEWVAWVLQADRRTVLIQAWDMVPGRNWASAIQNGLERAQRIVAIVSPGYMSSVYGSVEWQAAWADDPFGLKRKLITVIVRPTPLPGVLRNIVGISLVGLSEEEAEQKLRKGVEEAISGTAKPERRPSFPNSLEKPRFPTDPTSERGFQTENERSIKSSINILHLPHLRLGDYSNAEDNLVDQDRRINEIVGKLCSDMARIDPRQETPPDLIAITGNISVTATPREYDNALKCLMALSRELDIDQSRFIIVPGPQDVNLAKCEAYFLNAQADEEKPVAPYWPKWKPFANMFAELYGQEFRMDEPWSFVTIPELRTVVAGINSTMAESHLEHYGLIGDDQLNWFASRLEQAESRGWLRLAVVSHNPMLDDARSGIPASDIAGFRELILPRLNAVIHGQRSSEHVPTEPTVTPVIASPNDDHRSSTIPPYQLINMEPDSVRIWSGPESHRTDQPSVIPVRLANVHEAFSNLSGGPRGSMLAVKRQVQYPNDDLLSRMAEVYRLRFPAANVREVRPPDATQPYLHVGIVHQLAETRQQLPVDQFPIGLCQGPVTVSEINRFLADTCAPYSAGGSLTPSKLVYSGPPASSEARRHALHHGVELLSFSEFQLGYDLRPYARRQAEALERDIGYRHELYVTQRFTEIGGYDALPNSQPQPDILARLRDWFRDPDGHLVVVLGPSGHGKTFLLRELSRQMYIDRDPAVPVLVHLRDLEKTHNLDQLVAAQLTAGGERKIDLTMFRYLFREGRVALLFDGFDELADRMTYDAAASHLERIVQAIDGRAKVVITSREEHFLTDFEVLSVLGDRLATVAGRRLVKLMDFDEDQIETFLQKRLPGADDAQRRLDLLRDISDLLGLSRNPSMLDFISSIDEERLVAVQRRSEKITKATLYRELLDHWLTYEVGRKDYPGAISAPTREQFWYAVTFLALRLWNSTESSIGLEALRDAADELSKLSVSEVPTDSLRSDRDELAHSIGSGTLLVRDGEGRFKFVHQSVMEYLVAQHIAERIEKHEHLRPSEQKEMSLLTVEFLCDLLGEEQALSWASSTMSDQNVNNGLEKNALNILRHLNKLAGDLPLSGRDLRGRDFSSRSLQGVQLSGTDLTEANLSYADLSNAQLDGARLVRARLDKSRLVGANLKDADLTSASLLGADLTGADLSGATLQGAALIDATFDESSLAELQTSWGAAFSNNNLPEVQYRSSAGDLRAISVNAQLVASGGNDGVLRIWDLITGSQLREWTGHMDEVLSLAFSSDGRRLASGSAGGLVHIWDPVTGHQFSQISGHTDRVWSVEFAPAGDRLASAGSDGVVKLWDSNSGELLFNSPRRTSHADHDSLIWALAFSPDGARLASGGDDGTVRLWNLETASLDYEWRAHASAVLSIKFSHDGALVSSGADGYLRVWDPQAGTQKLEWIGHGGGPVWSVGYSNDGKWLASGGDDKVLRIWDASTGALLKLLTGHDLGEVRSLGFSIDDHWLVSTGNDRAIRVWNPRSGALTRKWSGHTDALNSVGFSQDGLLIATAGDDCVIRVWDARTAVLKFQLQDHTDRAWAMVFSPKSRWLASAGADGLVRLWHSTTGTLEGKLAGHKGRVRSLRFTPDGQSLASAGDDSIVRIWDPSTGAIRGECVGHTGRVRSLAYTKDGNWLVSGGDDGTVRIWDPSTSELEKKWDAHTGAVWALWPSPDKPVLAVGGSDGKISLLNLLSGRIEKEESGDPRAVSAVAFSPGGEVVASAGTGGLIRLWDATTFERLGELVGHIGPIWSIGFSPDGRWLVSGGADSVLRVWNLDAGTQHAALLKLSDGWAVLGADLAYKMRGNPGGEFWYVSGLCRFEPGELDPYVADIRRVAEDSPMFTGDN